MPQLSYFPLLQVYGKIQRTRDLAGLSLYGCATVDALPSRGDQSIILQKLQNRAQMRAAVDIGIPAADVFTALQQGHTLAAQRGNFLAHAFYMKSNVVQAVAVPLHLVCP